MSKKISNVQTHFLSVGSQFLTPRTREAIDFRRRYFCVTRCKQWWHLGITSPSSVPPSVCLSVTLFPSHVTAGDTCVPWITLVSVIHGCKTSYTNLFLPFLISLVFHANKHVQYLKKCLKKYKNEFKMWFQLKKRI